MNLCLVLFANFFSINACCHHLWKMSLKCNFYVGLNSQLRVGLNLSIVEGLGL